MRIKIFVGDVCDGLSVGAILDALMHKIATEIGWDRDSFNVSYEIRNDNVVSYYCYYPQGLIGYEVEKSLESIGLIFNA